MRAITKPPVLVHPGLVVLYRCMIPRILVRSSLNRFAYGEPVRLIRIVGEDIITPPKTPKSNRAVTMPGFVSEELEKYLGMLHEQSASARVFPLTKHTLYKEMVRACKISGVKKFAHKTSDIPAPHCWSNWAALRF